MTTFLWHDYETFGADPVRDRPAQFAGLRTDQDLNIIDDPVIVYCRPSDDYVPDPTACLITGITPQKCLEEGLPETEFIGRIQDEFLVPQTCGAGYNSLRFDDEVTRHTLYRNFRDPYAREWKNGNSRWDIIDMVRLAYAVRPEGLEWPKREDGTPSFRLEDLTQANGIEHGAAHDAMSDVYATIDLARLIRQRQRKLYDYVLSSRDKKSAFSMLEWREKKPVFHVSSMFPASLGCCALVVPLAAHPVNRNAVIVFDLRQDPSFLLSATAEEIRERLFVPRDELKEGEERVALKAVHANRCPVLAPASMLTSMPADRLSRFELDREKLEEHLKLIRQAEGLSEKISSVFTQPEGEREGDPDEMLYGGGFFSPEDRSLMEQVVATSPDLLGELELPFQDQRLPELFFRYRARNYPATLSGEEQERWEQFRHRRLLEPEKGWRSLPEYFRELERLMTNEQLEREKQLMLQDLQFYGESLIPYL